MTVGENIKKYRIKADFSQRELGELAGVATGTIQQYELGKRQPRLEQLQKIANALDINILNLMDNAGFNSEIIKQAERMNETIGKFGISPELENYYNQSKKLYEMSGFEFAKVAEQLQSSVANIENNAVAKVAEQLQSSVTNIENNAVAKSVKKSQETLKKLENNSKSYTLLDSFLKLNNAGKKKVIEYIKDLSQIELYTKSDD